jgi:hypothetical protein
MSRTYGWCAERTTMDDKALLARINVRLAALRRWLAHDHNDAAFWIAVETTAPAAQRERLALRPLATMLHVTRATQRGKLHGRMFETLDRQRAWLAGVRDEMLVRASRV